MHRSIEGDDDIAVRQSNHLSAELPAAWRPRDVRLRGRVRQERAQDKEGERA